MNAVQIFALETFLERNYFASDEEGTIASIVCASFSTYSRFQLDRLQLNISIIDRKDETLLH